MKNCYVVTNVFYKVSHIVVNNVEDTVYKTGIDIVHDNVKNISIHNVRNRVYNQYKLFEYNDLEQYRNNL
jgi:hypothetical protein